MMNIHVPPPLFGRRVLRTLLAALAVAVLLSVVGAVWDLAALDEVDAARFVPRIGTLLALYAPQAAMAGILGGTLASVSRWLWSTGVTGTAVYAGVAAVGVALVVTFMLLLAELAPLLQVLWILLLGLAVGWGSLLTDRAAGPREGTQRERAEGGEPGEPPVSGSAGS